MSKLWPVTVSELMCLSSRHMFQACFEMLPRRCTEAWGFTESSEQLRVLFCLLKHNQAEYYKRNDSYVVPKEPVPKGQVQQTYGLGRTKWHLSHKMLLHEETGTITAGQQDWSYSRHTASKTGGVRCSCLEDIASQPKRPGFLFWPDPCFFLPSPWGWQPFLPLITTALGVLLWVFVPRNVTQPMESGYHKHFCQKYLNHLQFSHSTHFNHMCLFKHCSDWWARKSFWKLQKMGVGGVVECCTVKAEKKEITFCVSHSTAPLYVNISTTHQHLWGVQFTFWMIKMFSIGRENV